MLNSLKNENCNKLEDLNWLNQKNTFFLGRPMIYHLSLNWVVGYYKKLVNRIIDGRNIKLPMETNLLEEYLSGFDINYLGIPCKKSDNFDGCWQFDDEEKTIINIVFNSSTHLHRQRFTKVHELFHAIQSMDSEFKNLVDRLFESQQLTQDLLKEFLEKSANKATAIYLMPNDYVYKLWEYREIRTPKEFAKIFQVSPQMAEIRLKECKLVL